MVGTFFLQDSKELTDPIIQVGDNIKSGDVIGYVEAMKVMNEVTSDKMVRLPTLLLNMVQTLNTIKF